ncbi:hypothetical protein GCM10007853_04380 [Algimonas ampicilliniresistens]|uniref:Type IV toxin-antitoxin system AbiEi family antitoxin domain-containing protein n=1 Tax=Algimonas ampicilliniresistens TaxID=1298735 RepID=A0ABQ5V4V3_9PROT|nr:hypothetical protein GCM10007853_04380 [Algimonas ampicilliniresistens]
MTISTIRSRIQRKDRGSVFTPSDFLAVGSRTSIDKALSRLAQDGLIRRLSQGVYDYPKISPRFGPLSPNLDDVADAIVRKDGHKLQIPPSRAANLLGLTNQVLANSVYLTNGRTRTRQVGQTSITLKQAAPKNLVAAGTTAGTVFQALRYVGATGSMIRLCTALLSRSARLMPRISSSKARRRPLGCNRSLSASLKLCKIWTKSPNYPLRIGPSSF